MVPLEPKHRDKAQRNRDFAEQLLQFNATNPTFLEWAVTAAFYCSVHCIEAYLATFGLHSGTHVQRETFMAQPAYGVPDDVFAAHRQLKEWSIQSRYRMRHFSEAVVRQTVLGRFLPVVTRFVGL